MPTYSNNAWEGRRASLNAQQKVSDQVAQNNMVNAKDKKEEFKKLVYGLATGQLENRSNTKAELDSGNQLGSFTGNNKEEWGASVGTHHIFFNPAVAQQKEKPSTVPYMKDEPKAEPIPYKEPENWQGEPEKENFFNDNLKSDNVGQIRNQEQYNLNLDALNNFDLGSGNLDQFRTMMSDGSSNLDFKKYLNSLPEDKQKQLEDQFTKLKDPNYRKALGQLSFNTGTDATPMSAESRKRLTDIYNNENSNTGKFARENGFKLDDQGMQRMLGHERYSETNNLFNAAASHYGVDAKDLVKPYSKDNHTLGKKKFNPTERYGKFQSVNGNTVTVTDEPTTINANVQKNKPAGKMPWQKF